MLAQNFKSAADLGLDEQEKEALVKTLVLLETGKIIHVRDFRYLYGESKQFTGHFNMVEWRAKAECGTVTCIGGTAELVGNLIGGSFSKLADHNRELRLLVCPPISHDLWEGITTQQAAKALRSYLTTGEARWDLAIV